MTSYCVQVFFLLDQISQAPVKYMLYILRVHFLQPLTFCMHNTDGKVYAELFRDARLHASFDIVH